MSKKVKKAGRVRSSCIKCGSEYSTHSSNRNMCHKCKPKCRERHRFVAAVKPKKTEQAAFTVADVVEQSASV